MNDLQKELNAIWNLLAGIPVSGDVVDVMAAARGGLRRAFKMAEGDTISKPTEGDDTNGG